MRSKIPYIAGGAFALIVIIALIVFMGGRGPEQSSTTAQDSEQIAASDRPTAQSRTTAEAPSGSGQQQAQAPIAPVQTGLRLDGLVLAAETNQPVAGALIRLYPVTTDLEAVALTTTEANEAGEFTFDNVQDFGPRGRVVAEVSAKGFATTRTTVEAADYGDSRTAKIRVELEQGATLAGIVKNTDGQPVIGAEVGIMLRRERPSDNVTNPYPLAPVAKTDGAGRFEIEGLKPGESYQLAAMSRGYFPAFTPQVPADSRTVEITLTPGEAAIKGYVQDPDGNPVANAAVRAYFRPMGRGIRIQYRFPDADDQFTRTDEEGYFEFPALKAGQQTVVADLGSPLPQSTGETVLVKFGEERNVTLRFAPPLELRGQFVDAETNEPISGVRVANPTGAKPDLAGKSIRGDELVSDFEGRFTLETAAVEQNGFYVVPPIRYLLPDTWGIDAETWQEATVNNWGGQRGSRDQTFRISRSLALEGRVLYADAETPAAGAELTVVIRPNRGGWGGGGGQGGPGAGMMALLGNEPVAKSDANGRFRVKARQGNNITITARLGEFEATRQMNVLETNEPFDLILDQLASIEGRITDNRGNAIPGAEVAFLQVGTGGPGGFDLGSVMTDSDGRYRKDGLRPGNLRVIPQSVPGKLLVPPELQQVPIASGDKATADFVYEAGLEFFGRVIDEQGAPVSRATVSLLEGQWGIPATNTNVTTDDGGLFELAIRDSGRAFSLRVAHPSFDSETVRELFPEDSPVTIQVPARGEIRLTAWLSGSSQLTTYEYQVTPRGNTQGGGPGGWMAQNQNRLDGFAFDQVEPLVDYLSPGTYTAHVYEIDRNRGRTGLYGFTEFEITAENKNLDVRVMLGESITIAGQVVDGESKPMAGVTVTLQPGGQGGGWGGARRGTRNYTTDESGSFRFELVQPAEYNLRAQSPGYVQIEDVSLNTSDGKTPDPVTIVLDQGGIVFGNVITGLDRNRRDFQIDVQTARGNRHNLNDDLSFEIGNVPPGDQRVRLLTRNGSVIEEQRVNMTVAAREEVTFDISGRILFSGNLYINDSRDRDRSRSITLRSQGEAPSVVLTANQGAFEHYVYPGVYRVLLGRDQSASDTGVEITLDANRREVNQDIRVNLYSAGIVIVWESTLPFQPVSITLSHRAEEGGRNSQRTIRAQRNTFYQEGLPAGEYRARFTARDGIRYSSPWTPVGPGEENIITVLPDEIPG